MSEWQSIETAPRDKWILAWWPESLEWGPEECIAPAYWREYKGESGRFQDVSDAFIYQPTHWMPLPPPPSAA